MTNEEIENAIKEINESLAKMSDENSLSKEERRRKQTLPMEKETLERIKLAREKGNLQQEINQTVQYAVLKAMGKRHPLLMYLAQIKFRSHIFS